MPNGEVETTSRPTLLLVDGDSRGLRSMEVGLRAEGFKTVAVGSAGRALGWLAPAPPACVVSSAELPDGRAVDLRDSFRKRPGWAGVPFFTLTPGLDLAAPAPAAEPALEDFISRPFFLRELAARLRLMLEAPASGLPATGDGIARRGSLADSAIVELLALMRDNVATGVVYAETGSRRGRVYVQLGRVIDARVGMDRGEEALFRILRWPHGTFTLDSRDVGREDGIDRDPGEVLREVAGKVAEWRALRAALPGHDPVLDVDDRIVGLERNDLSDADHYLLCLFDGLRPVSAILHQSPAVDLEVLGRLLRLLGRGVLRVVEGESAPLTEPNPTPTGPVVLVEVPRIVVSGIPPVGPAPVRTILEPVPEPVSASRQPAEKPPSAVPPAPKAPAPALPQLTPDEEKAPRGASEARPPPHVEEVVGVVRELERRLRRGRQERKALREALAVSEEERLEADHEILLLNRDLEVSRETSSEVERSLRVAEARLSEGRRAAAAAAERIERLEAEKRELLDQVAALKGAKDSLEQIRGYVGKVRRRAFPSE